VVEVEFAVSVAVTELVVVRLTEDGMEQVTGLVPPAGAVVTWQLKVTVPVKAFAGVTYIVEVLPEAAPWTTDMAPVEVSAKVGVETSPLTSAVMPRVCTNSPVESWPVIATLKFPLATPEGTSMASVEVEFPLALSVGLGEMVQLSGRAATQARLTAPEKPLTEETLMVSVPLLAPPLTLTGTMVVLGTSVKSALGFAIEPFSVYSEGA
jgi:hypothetical protein